CCRVSASPFRLPGGLPIPHWSRHFALSDQDRTVLFYQFDGVPYPRGAFESRPAIFAGFLPQALCGAPAVLVCRLDREGEEGAADPPALEGIALIPRTPDGVPCYDAAYVVPHPRHSGSSPGVASRGGR